MVFVKFLKVTKANDPYVQGFNQTCYIFPKLDGTNASLWWDQEKGLQAGSRNRHLSLENDNAGFNAWALSNEQKNKFEGFFRKYPDHRLFGEFNLNKGKLKTYPKDMERKLFVFDVCLGNEYLKYDDYLPLLEEFNIDYVKCISVLLNPKLSELRKMADSDTTYVEKGVSEGIVAKNYDFRDKYGKFQWVKFLSTTYTAGKKSKDCVESKFLASIEDEFYHKCINKVIQSKGEFDHKEICNLVFRDVIEEELHPYILATNCKMISFGPLRREISNIITNLQEMQE